MDPSMMSGFADMLKNPAMMKTMEDMMKNPDIMSNAMNMMKDPSIQNMFSGIPSDNLTEQELELELEENSDNDLEFNVGEIVLIDGLNNDMYNNQNGIIKYYNINTSRYAVFIEELDKTISIKEDNLTKKDKEIYCVPIDKDIIEVN
jgi:hypothetical protein